MKRYGVKEVLALGLLLVFALTALAGCAGSAGQSKDLTAGVKAHSVSPADLTEESAAAIANFAVRLGQETLTGEGNSLISPLSILSALAMTANGAAGETLNQMEAAFGLSLAELNAAVPAWSQALPSAKQYQVNLANAIWFKDSPEFAVEEAFLQTNADHYGAAVYKAPFDQGTLGDINNWVKEQTQGMIPAILDQIPDDAVMYLVNALAFDAEWQNIYKESQVRDGDFTTQAGEKRRVEMMHGEESRYLDDGRASGFVKYYADQKYAFVALLPKAGLSLDDYLASLTGEGLLEALRQAKDEPVDTGLPKFESEYGLEMSEALQALGISAAFDAEQADFSGLGSSPAGNIVISRVLHKTYIAVDEKGTKAGAATAVEMAPTSAAPMEKKSVILDRPFLYLLIDTETDLPLFIGTVRDIGE